MTRFSGLGTKPDRFSTRSYTPVNPADPANADAIKKVESRSNGVLNIVRMDSSAKALNAKSVINNLKDNVPASVSFRSRATHLDESLTFTLTSQPIALSDPSH